MSRTRLLLIHVGRHKTGTTAVQKQLHTLQRPLRRRGILVPSTGLSQQQHLLFPASCLPEHPALPPGQPPKPDALIQHLDQEWERSKAPCCLLSSEVFCELAFRQPAESQALLQQLHAITDQLRLLQVVRPLRDTILSAIKHQLRNDHLLQRSPLSWAEHCRRKQTALDHHWIHSGHPLLTLPYSSHRIVDDLLHAVLREIGREATWPRLRRHLKQAQETRPNADELPEAIYAAQLIQIVQQQQAGQAPIGLATLWERIGQRLPTLPNGCFEALVNLPQQATAPDDWALIQTSEAWALLQPLLSD